MPGNLKTQTAPHHFVSIGVSPVTSEYAASEQSSAGAPVEREFLAEIR